MPRTRTKKEVKRRKINLPSDETVGGRILKARLDAGIVTQQELGDLIHVSARSIQAYENNEVVPYRYLKDISEVLNVSMGWILHGEDAPETTGDLKPVLEEILKTLKTIAANTDGKKPASRSRR